MQLTSGTGMLPSAATSASTWQEAKNPARTWLPDPIEAEARDLHLVPRDQLLHPNALQSLKLWGEQTFVNLPKAVKNGLKGDPSYTFSDFLQVAKIPYYLGGTVLTLSFLAGGDKRNSVRQGLGVLLYYLGIGGTSKGIDKLTEMRTGLDLSARYRKGDGKLEKAFASADFPRLDLMGKEDYLRIQKKLGIPHNIADPVNETNRQIRDIISDSRANKLIVGNLLAALGAAYIARSDGWARLIGNQGTLKSIWQSPEAGSVAGKLKKTGIATSALLEKGIQEKFTGALSGSMKKLRVVALGTMVGAVGYGVYKTLTPSSPKDYQAPKIFSANGLGTPDTQTPFRTFQAARLGKAGGRYL